MSAPQDVTGSGRVRATLDRLFGVGRVLDMTPLSGGYSCWNFDVLCERGRFFLKQYRSFYSHQVGDIKAAERFFAGEGLPVILPLPDRFGRDAFWVEENWYSLFSFVGGSVPRADRMPETTIRSLEIGRASCRE